MLKNAKNSHKIGKGSVKVTENGSKSRKIVENQIKIDLKHK